MKSFFEKKKKQKTKNKEWMWQTNPLGERVLLRHYFALICEFNCLDMKKRWEKDVTENWKVIENVRREQKFGGLEKKTGNLSLQSNVLHILVIKSKFRTQMPSF